MQGIQNVTTHLARENQRENSKVSLAEGASIYNIVCDNNTGTWSQCGSDITGSEGSVKAPEHISRSPTIFKGVPICIVGVCAWILKGIEVAQGISKGNGGYRRLTDGY
jgi:hypothetical protein